MFTISRFATSSLLVLLTATLAPAAYARGGGHSGSNGSAGFNAPVYSDARIVTTHGNQTLSNRPVAHPEFVGLIVRDHRGIEWDGQIPNNYPCPEDCVGEGGLDSNSQPAPQQGGYKPRDGQVHDHRTGGAGQVYDHRN